MPSSVPEKKGGKPEKRPKLRKIRYSSTKADIFEMKGLEYIGFREKHIVF